MSVKRLGPPEHYDFERARVVSRASRVAGGQFRVQRLADETLIVERGDDVALTCHTRDLVTDPFVKRGWFYTMSPHGQEIINLASSLGLETR